MSDLARLTIISTIKLLGAFNVTGPPPTPPPTPNTPVSVTVANAVAAGSFVRVGGESVGFVRGEEEVGVGEGRPMEVMDVSGISISYPASRSQCN